MRIITVFARGVAWLLITVAKSVGAMQGGKTFDHDTALQMYARRDDYRP